MMQAPSSNTPENINTILTLPMLNFKLQLYKNTFPLFHFIREKLKIEFTDYPLIYFILATIELLSLNTRSKIFTSVQNNVI